MGTLETDAERRVQEAQARNARARRRDESERSVPDEASASDQRSMQRVPGHEDPPLPWAGEVFDVIRGLRPSRRFAAIWVGVTVVFAAAYVVGALDRGESVDMGNVLMFVVFGFGFASLFLVLDYLEDWDPGRRR